MIPIPEELLEQIERGNVVLFIGERITRDAAGQAVLDQLTAQLGARCQIPKAQDLRFPEAAQAYEDEWNRQALVQFIRDQMEALGDAPQRVHYLIADLTDCKVLATTCLDRRLERALKERERQVSVIVRNEDVAFADERKVQVYKLRGSVERPDSLVLTTDQYEAFAAQTQTSLVLLVLQGYLARRTIVFVGFDLADPHFRELYRRAVDPLDAYARRAYALFGEPPSWEVSRWCKRHNIAVVEVDIVAFLEALSDELASRPRFPIAVPPLPVEFLPERPYKFLDYYDRDDENIFFGREQEILELTSLIHAHRLVLLYGASGVGKTSLLRAGVLARLRRARPPYETICVRVLDDPARVIRRAVQLELPGAGLPEDGSLMGFLSAATKAMGRTLVIVLDQFEEFFIRHALKPYLRSAFIEELGDLYDARDVPVKVVLSLREDWLASVHEIRERIPEVFYIDMRLLPLTREQARQAITRPAEKLKIGYEPELVDRLLDDLTGSEGIAVMPPQLQIVCNALYERARAEGRQSIAMTDYRALGGAQGVLRKYLEDELARLGGDERALARGVLEELVTSQYTKAVKAGDELAMALGVNLSDVTPVLEKLVRARLLRVLEHEEGRTAYELAHEYLIREIGLGAEAQARKQAEEIIVQELANYRRFGTLLAPDKLALVDDVRTVLRLTTEARELLLRSALQHDVDIAYWLERMEDSVRRQTVLVEAAGSQQARLRRQAATALSLLDEAVSVEPLVKLAVEDQDADVRATAQASLVALTNQRDEVVARLVEIANGPKESKTAYALDSLAWYLHGADRPLSLPRHLQWPVQIRLARIRLRAARPQIDRQTRVGGLAALLGALPLATYLALASVDYSVTASTVVPFVVLLVLYPLLCGLGGMISGGGLAMAHAITRGWHPAARIGGMGLVGALLGLLALYPLSLEFWGWIVGLTLSLLLTAVDVVRLRPGRQAMTALGAVAGAAAGLTGLLLTGTLARGDTLLDEALSTIAIAVLAASISGTSVIRSKPGEPGEDT